MTYVCIDPSGSFNEGKGHTGIAILQDNNWDSLKTISLYANKYNSRLEYWQDIINNTIIPFKNNTNEVKIIIESFTIRSNGFLIGKMPETFLLLGAMVYIMEKLGISYIFQAPSAAKSRFKDEHLDMYIPNFIKRNNFYYLNGIRVNDHIRDALKHLLYYKKYNEYKEINTNADC